MTMTKRLSRDPTEAMVAAVPGSISGYPRPETSIAIWRAMYDAAEDAPSVAENLLRDLVDARDALGALMRSMESTQAQILEAAERNALAAMRARGYFESKSKRPG